MITLVLITVSWTVNAIRGGSLIVFVHDIADVLLEGVKALNYAKYERFGTVVFILFAIVWIITRLGVFARIVLCGIFDFVTLFPPYPLYYALVVLTSLLLVLHVVWTYMIFKVAFRMIVANKMDDVRSSSEDDENVSDHSCDNLVKSNGNGTVKNGHAKNGSALIH